MTEIERILNDAMALPYINNGNPLRHNDDLCCPQIVILLQVVNDAAPWHGLRLAPLTSDTKILSHNPNFQSWNLRSWSKTWAFSWYLLPSRTVEIFRSSWPGKVTFSSTTLTSLREFWKTNKISVTIQKRKRIKQRNVHHSNSQKNAGGTKMK